MGTVPLPVCPPGAQVPCPGPSLTVSPGPEESPGTGGYEEVGPHVSCSDTQLLLSLQVIHAYLKQTSNSCRPPALQHVWKVDREGEVRESPPITTTFSPREMALAYPVLRE